MGTVDPGQQRRPGMSSQAIRATSAPQAPTPKSQPPSHLALLIDATTYLYRAYFARRSLIGRDGSQVNAVYGFLETLAALMEAWGPEFAAAAFDLPGTPTFREREYPAYKQARPKTPERLVTQFAPAMEACRALGIKPIQVAGFEADDVLATLVHRLRALEVDCLVVGLDKDLAQLVRPGVWLYPFDEREPMDAAAVRERYGAIPERMPDLLALGGDAMDGLPGVPGITPKTAARLLSTQSSVEALWSNPAALAAVAPRGSADLAATLRGGRETFLQQRELVRLRDDLPLELADEELAIHSLDHEAVAAFCDRYGFDAMRDRIIGGNRAGTGTLLRAPA